MCLYLFRRGGKNNNNTMTHCAVCVLASLWLAGRLMKVFTEAAGTGICPSLLPLRQGLATCCCQGNEQRRSPQPEYCTPLATKHPHHTHPPTTLCNSIQNKFLIVESIISSLSSFGLLHLQQYTVVTLSEKQADEITLSQVSGNEWVIVVSFSL